MKNNNMPGVPGLPIKTASSEPIPGPLGMLNPANRIAAKVIYIITTEDPSSKIGVQHYVCLKQGFREDAKRIEITGAFVTSAQASKLTTDKAETLLGKTQLNILIPWSRVVSIKNLTFSKAQKGESNE